jgi:hypothetical protein
MLFNFFFNKVILEQDIYDYRSLKTNNKPWLVISSSKKNQNFYRDQCLARMTGGVLLTETFDFSQFGFNLQHIIDSFFKVSLGGIFVNYICSYTYKINFENVRVANICGFVGDHYNFIDKDEASLRKQNFYKIIPWKFIVSAYPHTNNNVKKALGVTCKFITLPWAIDPSIYKDLNMARTYDFACMGALSKEKYPFRNNVRDWMLNQSQLKIYKKSRSKGLNRSDHDGTAFNFSLNNCRSAFTCCSSMNYTLMKYFEIPATGALLFAEKTILYEQLGFEDGIHYVAVNSDNYKEKINTYLSKNYEDVVYKITDNAKFFLNTHHTWNSRIDEFLKNFN